MKVSAFTCQNTPRLPNYAQRAAVSGGNRAVCGFRPLDRQGWAAFFITAFEAPAFHGLHISNDLSCLGICYSPYNRARSRHSVSCDSRHLDSSVSTEFHPQSHPWRIWANNRLHGVPLLGCISAILRQFIFLVNSRTSARLIRLRSAGPGLLGTSGRPRR